ncbi:MAG: carbohydrate kinase [Lachnospira sp.]|nr:carbohydrate kinase [Lachnospira sp.]
MKKLLAIGEALIDFIPGDVGKAISEVSSFNPKVGGAPANVCGCFKKLGGESAMITQVGADAFGDKIVNELASFGIDTSTIKRTNKATTSLAFVALKEDGNREFAFFRKPGADMLYEADYLEEEVFKDNFGLHFCSVDLGNFPMKEAHKKAIKLARDNGGLISFDPNLRFNLWDSKEELYKAVWEFIPEADILKISDEEIDFIAGTDSIEEALPKLMQGNVKLVIYTTGSKGAYAFSKEHKAFSKATSHKAADTTGAGDGFIGAFLNRLAMDNVKREGLESLDSSRLQAYLDFANVCCGLSVTRKGAIASYPTEAEILEEMKNYKN